MKLITAEIRKKLLANHGKENVKPPLKLFNPFGSGTWLIADIDPEDPDYAFGLCDLGQGFPELGYVSISELSSLKGPFGAPLIERDMYFTPEKTLVEYAEEARNSGRLVA